MLGMKSRIGLARTAASGVLAVVLASQTLAAEPEADPAADHAALVAGKILKALIETNGVPGMGAAVWHDDQVVWSGSAGYRDIDKQLRVNADTIFRLASVSKLLGVAAAARLEQDGSLDIDQPVASILPWLSPRWATLTTRQLAAHTAGLPHYQDVDAQRGGTRYANVREAVGIFQDRDLLFPPGSDYSYSSWGYTLLSAVAEHRAGVAFLDFVANKITPGLMIVPDATNSGNPDASIAYEFVDGRPRPADPHDFSYTWAGGGMGGTPAALAEFGGRMMRGTIVSAATFEQMLTPARLNDGSVVMDKQDVVGFGWRTGTDLDGARIAHHAGVTIGARSALVLWPDQSMAVSLLSNALWVSSIEQSAVMIAAPFRPAPAGLVASECPTASKHYEGRFGESRVAGSVSFAVKDGVCTGEIVLDKVLADYFDPFLQKDALTLRLVGLDTSGGLSRAALVTPIGIFDARALIDGSYTARFGPNRTLTLRFD